MSNYLLVLNDRIYAGHCTSGSSDKVWAACLAIETSAEQGMPPDVSDTTEVVYLSVYGRRGSNLNVTPPKRLPLRDAQKLFKKKCGEKDGEAYAHVPFAPFVSTFGYPLGFPLVARLAEEEVSVITPASAPVSALSYVACVVKDVRQDKLQQLLQDPDYGLTEKVDGERCIIVFDGQELAAFNRKGKQMMTVPAGALHLRQLGCRFVIDGERMMGALAGHFVAFDLLEWGEEPFTAWSYVRRITTLEEAMLNAGLLLEDRSTPTHLLARSNSACSDLALLVAAPGEQYGQRVINAVRAASGEGIIVRNLTGDYQMSPLKFKFVTDLEAFVIAANDGLEAGSLKFGLVRPDGAVIEIANVRSGFNAAEINAVRQMLDRGERPVFKVTYLPKRTVGLLLVEPKSGMSMLRSDKDAAECTTDQLGEEKAELVAQAKPLQSVL